MHMHRRITMKELAALAGVNPSTVSRALARHPRISVAQGERIRSMAEKLGYRPDPGLRALANHRWQGKRNVRHHGIAWITTNTAGVDRDPILAGARQRAEACGYALTEFRNADFRHPERTQRTLLARGIQGLLFRVSRTGVHRPAMDWNRFSVLNVGLHPDAEEWGDVVSTDVFHLHHLALRKVWDRGYRKPGLVFLRPEFLHEETLRYGGAQSAWRVLMGGDEALPVFWLNNTPEGPALERWIKVNRIDVILGQTDAPALYLRQRGWDIPGDIGFAHLGLNDAMKRPSEWSGILHRLTEVGARAVDVIVAKIEQNHRGLPESPACIFVAGGWHEGRSLRPATQGI